MHSVRRAATRDAEAVARMAAEASLEDGLPAPSLDADLVRAHGFGMSPLFESWIAEDRSGRPLGAAIASKGYDVQAACATLVVSLLYVAPEARRSGLARQVISEISKRAMELGARELIITTGVENAVARRFFAAIGANEREQASFTLERDAIEWLAEEVS